MHFDSHLHSLSHMSTYCITCSSTHIHTCPALTITPAPHSPSHLPHSPSPVLATEWQHLWVQKSPSVRRFTLWERKNIHLRGHQRSAREQKPETDEERDYPWRAVWVLRKRRRSKRRRRRSRSGLFVYGRVSVCVCVCVGLRNNRV